MGVTTPLYVQTLIAMLIGAGLGVIFPQKLIWLGELGKALIVLIKIFAAPLLFFAIIDAICFAQVQKKGLLALVCLCLINGIFAIVIGLSTSNFFQAGSSLAPLLTKSHAHIMQSPVTKLNLSQSISTLVPESLLSPFVSNSILSIIVIALCLGFGIRAARAHTDSTHLEALIKTAYYTFLKIIEGVVRFIPLAVFGVVAKSVSEHGLEVFKGLGAYLVVGILGLTLQIVLVYFPWIVFSGIRLGKFLQEAREPLVYSFGVNSSLATLPLTLRALENLRVSPSAARLSACVGTNFNNDGIILYEALAVLFVAQAHGITLSLPEQISAAGLCVIAGYGIAGVPDAGLISLSLVLSSVGLPLEALPVLMSVDWVLGRYRSVINVFSDMTGGAVLNKLIAKDSESC